MKAICHIFVLVGLILPHLGISQKKTVSVKFVPYFSGAELKADSVYVFNNDSISVSVFGFYITNAKINTSNGEFPSENRALLVDPDSGKTTLNFLIPKSSMPVQITFDLGIDSTTNTSGAMPGDLDPMHGMYWIWQSGYINVKLEGKSSKSTGRNKEFQYHLGGYAEPFSAIQEVSLVLNNSDEIIIKVNVDEFLKAADLQKTNHVMRPCAEAVSLSKILAAQFVLN